MVSLLVAALSAVFLAVEVALLREISIEVPAPYMDEVFHFNQTRAYCKGHWREWDPAITTPPGTYLLALAWDGVLGSMGLGGNCSLVAMRSLNVIMHVGGLLLAERVTSQLHEAGRAEPWCLVRAATVALLPTHFFFAFLYYTDIAGAFLVLLTYWCVLRQRTAGTGAGAVVLHACGALAGAFAVLVRQTNAVWLCFILGQQVVSFARGASATRGKPTASGLGPELVGLLRFLASRVGLRLAAWRLGFYFLVVLLFVGFVVVNGGIVLGDKANHAPALHFAQLAYFPLFSAVFGVGELIGIVWGWFALVAARRGDLLRSSDLPWFGVLCLVVFLALRLGFITHPFLLSDHRHFTFHVRRCLPRSTPVSLVFLCPNTSQYAFPRPPGVAAVLCAPLGCQICPVAGVCHRSGRVARTYKAHASRSPSSPPFRQLKKKKVKRRRDRADPAVNYRKKKRRHFFLRVIVWQKANSFCFFC